jgi:hypothetical protein
MTRLGEAVFVLVCIQNGESNILVKTIGYKMNEEQISEVFLFWHVA